MLQISRPATAESFAAISVHHREEVAWTCAFLCSLRSGAVTGTVVDMDGGWPAWH
jgi:3-oxoacyl-[acyl-carrier protein] reductase